MKANTYLNSIFFLNSLDENSKGQTLIILFNLFNPTHECCIISLGQANNVSTAVRVTDSFSDYSKIYLSKSI